METLTAASYPITIDQGRRPGPGQRSMRLRMKMAAAAALRGDAQRRLMEHFFDGLTWSDDMKRGEWTVPYTGEQLAEAAAEKKEYHAGRQQWWQDKKDEVIGQIREGGITINESIVDEMAKTGYAATMRGHGGPTVQIDEGMQQHLSEAHEKVKSHTALVKEYDAWNQMMSAHKTASFQLTQGDWMYFFGK